MLRVDSQDSTYRNVLNAKQRRSRLDICFELLEVIWTKDEIKPTQLMYKANLSWRMLSEILTYLSERELVNFTAVGTRRTVALTEKGRRCLQRLHEARCALIPEDQDSVGDFGESAKVFPSVVAPPVVGGNSQGTR